MAEVKTSFPTLDKLANFKQTRESKKILKEVGDFLVKEVVRRLNQGRSITRGVGRLVSYKDPVRYPGDKKAARPVNLKLSGDLHASIDHKIVRGLLQFGVMDSSQKKKAQGLISGLIAKPKRPRKFIPQSGDDLEPAVIRDILKVVEEGLAEFIKKASK